MCSLSLPLWHLVSQAHREWLRFRDSSREISTLIVCSDKAAGRAGANDIKPLELASPPTTDPETLAEAQKALSPDAMHVVFSTYQSLSVIQKAQATCGLPEFGLAICDEAHRTTGVVQQDASGNNTFENFQLIHDGNAIHSQKRIYMTATPRIYNPGTYKHFRSQAEKAESNNWLLDMKDDEVYGQKFYRLGFRKAVENQMLADFKVIVSLHGRA